MAVALMYCFSNGHIYHNHYHNQKFITMNNQALFSIVVSYKSGFNFNDTSKETIKVVADSYEAAEHKADKVIAYNRISLDIEIETITKYSVGSMVTYTWYMFTDTPMKGKGEVVGFKGDHVTIEYDSVNLQNGEPMGKMQTDIHAMSIDV
jgi:hypothetical protein